MHISQVLFPLLALCFIRCNSATPLPPFELVGIEISASQTCPMDYAGVPQVNSVYKIRCINQTEHSKAYKTLTIKSSTLHPDKLQNFYAGFYICTDKDTLLLFHIPSNKMESITHWVSPKDTSYIYLLHGEYFCVERMPLSDKIAESVKRVEKMNEQGAKLFYFDERENIKQEIPFKNVFFNHLYMWDLDPKGSKLESVK